MGKLLLETLQNGTQFLGALMHVGRVKGDHKVAILITRALATRICVAAHTVSASAPLIYPLEYLRSGCEITHERSPFLFFFRAMARLWAAINAFHRIFNGFPRPQYTLIPYSSSYHQKPDDFELCGVLNLSPGRI